METTGSITKEGIVNLSGEELDENKIKLLNLGPEFVPTENRIEKRKLRKEKKFNNNTYFKLYPSDAIPPRLYRVIKARKPEKNYPMRTIVSTIGTTP